MEAFQAWCHDELQAQAMYERHKSEREMSRRMKELEGGGHGDGGRM